MAIHETALIRDGARIDSSAEIGPFTVLEADVEVGPNVIVEAHAVLKRGVSLAAGVHVHEGAVLGGDPQDTKFQGGPSGVAIGEGTVVRELATVHRSTQPGGVTRIGASCHLMANSHVAHDCDIGDGAVIASYSALAGHIQVGAGAFVSGGVVIHQFSRIGELAMIGGGSKVNLDVPPFFTVDGVPAGAVSVNVVGLRRASIEPAEIRALKGAYKVLYRSRLPLETALSELEKSSSPLVHRLVAFIRDSKRGVCRPRLRHRTRS
jgi:UDP-N-acetylglucosamine acyltransferase